MKSALAIIVMFLVLSAGETAPGEVFVLAGGGQISGKLLNPQQSPRRNYVIAVADGAKLTLDASEVRQVVRQREEEIEYERIRPSYADTAAAQWELAQWCRDHKLNKQREVHLQRVIELDPDHAEARRALGYSQVDGRWVTQAEIMTQRGYQRYKGQWKLPQEIELLEGKRKLEAGQQEWFQNLKRWRGWLHSDRDRQARENIRAIDNPLAVKALAVALRDDTDPSARLLYIESLGKIGTPEAAKALAIASVYDPVEEIRLTCLDHLQKNPSPEIVAYYVGKLRDKDNRIVNLAGFALGRIKATSAVGPLIDALVTTHKFKLVKPGGDGAVSTTFGTGPGGSGAPGGGGLSAGGGPTFIRQQIANQAVLDALTAITGQNFNFDKQAWKYWLAAQKKPPESLDARRD